MDEQDTLESLVEKIRGRGDTYTYFFDQIDDPRWLEPLRDRGFFTRPVPPEHLEGGFVRFPFWPESRALARLADRAGDLVLELIAGIPDTDNPRVFDDFGDAALQMSPENAARLVPRLMEGLDKPYTLLLPIKAGRLLQRLAEEGMEHAALELARGLLALAEPATLNGGDRESFARPGLLPRFDQYEYEAILKSNVPGFVRALGPLGLGVLCEVLQVALASEGKTMGGKPHDVSYIWRPTIHDSEQNHDRDPKAFLVSAIRDGALMLCEESLIGLSDVVSLLEGYGWEVLDRLAMHVASSSDSIDSRPSLRLMLRRDLFDSMEVSYEYGLLTQRAFRVASPNEKSQILAWIDEGPDLTTYSSRIALETGAAPTSDELDERSDRWRWNRLVNLPDDELDDDWRSRKEQMEERFGRPSGLPFYTSGYFGSESPLEIEAAATMSTAELAAFASGVPDSEDRYSSPEEGLGLTLQSLARDEPARFSAGLLDFVGLKPVYVRSVLSGLWEAAKDRPSEIDWERVLQLAEWVFAQPRELEGGSGGTYSDLDPGWVWTIKAIADLLEAGLRSRAVDPACRERVWQVITTLLRDPEESVSVGIDAASDSLNMTRGRAMHAAILYANWLFEANRVSGELPPRSFDTNSPEVVEVFDAHLDQSVEASSAVRGAYGMQISLLAKLDPEWLSSRASRLFSVGADGDFDELGYPTWASYLRYGGRHLEVMRLLRGQYEVAAAVLGSHEGRREEGESDLAEHIGVMYWHGMLGYEPDDPLLLQFLASAPAKLRHHFLEYLGHSLRQAPTPVGEEVLRRLASLWESRVTALSETRDFFELKAFGWWMSSDAFEPGWSLDRLLEVLQLAKEVDPDHLVVASLADMDGDDLPRALTCLLLIIETDREGWGVYGWKDDALRLIQKGLSNTGETARRRATDAANILIARGFPEFRSLLEGSSS